MTTPYEPDIFKRAVTFGSFNQWITTIPEEDLAYLEAIAEQVTEHGSTGDPAAIEQLCALVIHFAGRTEMPKAELDAAFNMLAIDLAAELNVRRGDMARTGFYSLIPGEETVEFSVTPQGTERIGDMKGGAS